MAYRSYTSYALLGLALLTASCSQEGPARGESGTAGRIAFKVSLPEISSRATEMNGSLLDEFQVSSFIVGESSETLYFADKRFVRDRNTGTYICYDEECRWPNSSAGLRFIAFSPSCGFMKESGGSAVLDGDKLTDFRVAEDIASQYDFLTAIAGGNLEDNEETGISLTMRHQLSRVFIKAWGGSASYDLEIAGVRIGGVGKSSTFSLSAPVESDEAAHGGVWESVTNGYVEYIYRAGDEVVKLDGAAGTHDTAGKAVSILGAKVGDGEGYENSAMVIPTDNPAWDYKENPSNGDGHEAGKYLCVLVRVMDDTPYETNGETVYPVKAADKSVWLALDSADGKTVKTRVYTEDGERFFTDGECTVEYDLEANDAMAKAFGWAALPVEEAFLPGHMYTYTLNYTSGVGLRNPHDPEPGEPIISERVLVNVEVEDWKQGTDSDVTVPRR